MNVAWWVIRAIALKRSLRECPYCRAGDPFFDSSRVDHVIRTEAGVATTRCASAPGDGADA